MERSITWTSTVRRATSSIGAVATRFVVSGGDSTVGSEAGVEGEGPSVAAGGLSVMPLRSVAGGGAVAPDGRLTSGEGLGSETSLVRLALMPSRRGSFIGSLEGAVTAEGSSIRACSCPVDTGGGGLTGLASGSTLTGTAVQNPVGVNNSARARLAARLPITSTVRTRWRRLPR
jgi:hypothetical protein